jgi:hypothetical protein
MPGFGLQVPDASGGAISGASRNERSHLRKARASSKLLYCPARGTARSSSQAAMPILQARRA